MRDRQSPSDLQLQSSICESDLGFELLDMLAQANIDFRRLPEEELQELIGHSRRSVPRKPRRSLVPALA